MSSLPGLRGISVMERVLDRAWQLTGSPTLAPTEPEPATIELKVPVGA